MEKLMEVFAMGGYGAFVWPAYGLAALMMLGITVVSLRDLRRTQAILHQLQLPPDADEA